MRDVGKIGNTRLDTHIRQHAAHIHTTTRDENKAIGTAAALAGELFSGVGHGFGVQSGDSSGTTSFGPR